MAFDCIKALIFNLKSQIMYLISYETANFCFCYVSESESLGALRRAWAKHCKETKADKQHLIDNLDAVKVLSVEFNQVFRDFEPFL